MQPQAHFDPIDTLRTLIEQGKLLQAALTADSYLLQSPNQPRLLSIRAKIALKRSNPLLAITLLEKAIALKLNSPLLHKDLASACLAAGFPQKSIEVATAAIEKFPSATGLHVIEIAALERLGRIEEALEKIKLCKALLQEPWGLEIKLAELEARKGLLEEGLSRIEALLATSPNIKVKTTIKALRTKSKICDSLGAYCESFEAASQANALQPNTFDCDGYVKQTDAIIEYFSKKKIASMPSSAQQSELPVFICGLPRSGTSLTEQILDCHSQIAGAGERRDFFLFTELLEYDSISQNPKCYNRLTEDRCNTFGDEYFKTLLCYGFGSLRVTNKQLQLERILGFLPSIVPGMKTIFVNRKPLDVGLSIFLHQFHPLRMGWTNSLDHIALVQKEHARLVEHWSQVLPTPYLELQYETLVENPKSTIQEVLTFLGVAWDDACLESHTSTRPVMTPSFDQVNKPINSSAINRWENYEEFLGPLIEAHPTCT